MKRTHVKPSFYALCFQELKDIAKRCGYNLVLHGSLDRDLDLIAIPWAVNLLPVEMMIDQMALYMGGTIMEWSHAQTHCFPHGRTSHVINLNRGEKASSPSDPMWYLDISVISVNKNPDQ